MKRLSVLLLIAVLALVGWALPAGAEKVRLTEDQMDTVSAGFEVPGFPVDKSFDIGGQRTFPQLHGLVGDFQGNATVQAPCMTAPSLLCLQTDAGVGAGFGGSPAFVSSAISGPLGANVAGFGNLYLFNWGGGNKIFQGNGGWNHIP